MTAEFSELGLSEQLLKAIEKMGWTEPTPIQTEAIPSGIEGRDLIAQAQTGTGKTGTYGSIILNRIPAEKGWAHALVLTPTRELALQVTDELEALSEFTGHRIVTVYGGVSMLKQTQTMDRGVDVIVATPGRLCDHLKDDEQLLDDVSILVLDEADRMLEMGFRRDLEFIMERIPGDRQTLLFSATMPMDVKNLALRYMDEPKEICVSTDEPVLDLIKQYYMDVEKDDKIETLRYVLAKDPMKTIVFCFTKYRVDKVVRKLKMSFKLAGIHGDVPQKKREEILWKFREGDIQVLVASDLAARGLDIENVGRIINLDMPPESETYIHRIGRTGRAGNEGIALSFIMKEEKRLLRQIENTTLIPVTRLDAPTEEEIKTVTGNIKTLSRPVMAKKNSRKNDVPVGEKEYILAEINIGMEDQQGKASIAQLLHDYTEVPKKSIGNIMPGQKTSTLEVEKVYLKRAIDGMSKCKINGKSVKMWSVSEFQKPIVKTVVNDDSTEGSERSKARPEKRTEKRSDARSSDRPRSNSRKDNCRRTDDRSGRSRSHDGESRKEGSYGRPRYEREDSDRPRREYKPRQDSDRRSSYGGDRPRYGYRSDGRDRRNSPSRDGRSNGRSYTRPRYEREDSDRPRREYRPRQDSDRRSSYGGDRPRYSGRSNDHSEKSGYRSNRDSDGKKRTYSKRY